MCLIWGSCNSNGWRYSVNNTTSVSNDVYYLLTPWSRVLLEKLASLQLVKKFPAFFGTRRFLTALTTSARHLSLSWASPIQSSYPNRTSWRSILLLSSHLHLGLPSGPFPSNLVKYAIRNTNSMNRQIFLCHSQSYDTGSDSSNISDMRGTVH